MQLQKRCLFRGKKQGILFFSLRNRGHSPIVCPLDEEQAVRMAIRNIRMYLIILFSVLFVVSVCLYDGVAIFVFRLGRIDEEVDSMFPFI